LASHGWQVIGLETAGSDSTYAWDETKGCEAGPQVITAFPGRVHEEITAAECKRVLHPILDELKPDAMAIAGWSGSDALSCLSWCRKHDKTRIVMSETREADGTRVWWKEWIKRYLISRFNGALVGGKSHRDYLVKLGMPKERVAFGYNVVDHSYFKAESGKWKAECGEWRERLSPGGCQLSDEPGSKNGEPGTRNLEPRTLPYFLASNRFIERKNLGRLIEAYGLYAAAARGQIPESRIWDLCLLGDGELKADLIAQCHRLGLKVSEAAPWEDKEKVESGKLKAESIPTSDLRPPTSDSSFQLSEFQLSAFPQGSVFFPGFRQIEELPKFYAHAGCFVHPALEEPWGLVLNEALACGLPILSGRNVGAAEELVDDGVNGWCFGAESVEEISGCLGKIAGLSDDDRREFGAASVKILQERCPVEAFGRGLAELLLP